MIDWKAHLTVDEIAKLAELNAASEKASIERRKIYQRAWRRAKLADKAVQ